MNPQFFGPPGWKFLHAVTFGYSDNPNPIEREHYKRYFESLQFVLPCIHCRRSYQQFYRELPIDNFLQDKLHLAYWMYLIHNKVNDKLRKQGKSVPKDPTFESVVKKYTKHM